MPARLTFQLSFSELGATPPEVSMWVDADRSGRLDDAEKLSGVRQDGASFQGSIEVPSPLTEGVAFRVKFGGAVAGSEWRLRITSSAPSPHVVYDKGGPVAFAKDSIAGRLGK